MGMTYLLHALHCLWLASVSLTALAKPVENDHQASPAAQRSSKLHKWQTDAKFSSSQRNHLGVFAMEASAQTNGFLHFPDAPHDNVRGRLIRSESLFPESSSPRGNQDIWTFPVAGKPSAGKEIHSHNMQPQQALDEVVSAAAFIGEAFNVKIASKLSNDTSNASSNVTSGASSSDTSGENTSVADNDWSAVSANTGVNTTEETMTAGAATGQNASTGNASNSTNSTSSTDNTSSTNVTTNATAAAGNQTEANSTSGGNASSPPAPPAPPANSTPEGNASSPPAPPAPPANYTPVENAPPAPAPMANASAPLVPAPAPVAPTPAPPVQIINKIINKVNVTVKVVNNGKDGTNGTSVKVDSGQEAGNSSTQAKSDAEKATEGESPMDIWNSIVHGGRDDTKTGGRNARVGDSSL